MAQFQGPCSLQRGVGIPRPKQTLVTTPARYLVWAIGNFSFVCCNVCKIEGMNDNYR